MADGDDLEDQESKTEDPSLHRLEKALEQGQVMHSREVVTFAMLLILCIMTIFILPAIIKKILLHCKMLIMHAGSLDASPAGLKEAMVGAFNVVIFYLSPVFGFLVIGIIFAFFMIRGQFVLSFENITPNPSRISIIKGFGKIFSTRNFVEFLKNIIKLALAAIILYNVLAEDMEHLRMYYEFSVDAILEQIDQVIQDILMVTCIMMFIIGGADFFYQKYDYMKSLMMSRYELKKEYRETEGSPEVKQKLRRLRMQASKQRMSTKIPKAEVVIVNPEHYAVALEYNDTMQAPKVIAKGVNDIAQVIKEIAKEHDVPIVENPPLARALYTIPLEQFIPPEHYKAVAEVIGYVYRLKKKKK